MEDMLDGALAALWEEGREADVFRVTIGDIVPVSAFEADLLRDRPVLRRLCAQQLEMEQWEYRQLRRHRAYTRLVAV